MFKPSRRAMLIAKRDYLTSVGTKTFLIGLVVFPLAFGGGVAAVAVIRARPDLRGRHVALIDRSGKLANFVVQAVADKNATETYEKRTGLQISPLYIVEPVAAELGDPNPQRLALSDRVRRGELFAFIETGDGDSAAVYTNAGATDRFQAWVTGAINDAIKMKRLTEGGIERARVPAMLAAAKVDDLDLVTRDAHTGAIHEPVKRDKIAALIVPLSAMLLLVMIAMMGCAPMLSAVTEDKSQRIVEMLLGMATPHELMIGKVMSGVARSLTASVLYVALGTVALLAFQAAGLARFSLLPWFYVYLVVEVTILCALSAALGAACNTPQEAQNLVMLVLAPILLPVLIMLTVINQPNGPFATAMSLFPPFTPLLMMMRQTMPGGVPAWQPWIGLLGIAIWVVAGVWVAGRVFRVAILVQGQPPRLGDMMRWAIKG